MRKQTLINAILIILAVFVGSIFDPLSYFEINNRTNNEQCIPPLGTWSYTFSPSTTPSVWLDIPISNNLQFVSNLPDPDHTDIIIARTSNEIWVYSSPLKLWRYEVNSGEWKEYSTVGNFKSVPDIRYLNQKYYLYREHMDSNLWAASYIFKTPTESFFAISKYNENTDQFQLIKYDEKTFNTYDFDLSRAEPDQNGVFWMMATQNTSNSTSDLPSAVFSLDPSTGKIEQHGNFEWVAADLAVGNDNNLWIVSENKNISHGEFSWLTKEDESIIHRELVRINPYTNEIHSYPDFILPGSGGVRFDRVGHLWVGSSDVIGKFGGWIDLSDPNNPVAYKIIPPSELLFVFDDYYFPNNYDHIILWEGSGGYQSADGSYWFGRDNGLVKLNPRTGKWCRITNRQTAFSEDNQRNMWLAVSGKLYKYSLDQ